ncbi:sensor histidine kinase [Enterococcus sp. 5H]|uniref:sensor histidine kinase n=1 Tax=Enterococcus sp. 5H TaxID=1229490 RepID=UPI0023045702|nr:GHKL domain-containing protein [Enterococcus sp. 5H]MDA9471381.1 ATPase-containing signal transduction protein [Enterococcus sp. 5H]
MGLPLEVLLLSLNYIQVLWLLGYKKYFSFRQVIFLTAYIFVQLVVYYVFRDTRAVNLLIFFVVLEFYFLIRFLQSWILAALYFLLQNTMMLIAGLITWDSFFILWIRQAITTEQYKLFDDAAWILQQLVLFGLIMVTKKISAKYNIFESVSQLQKKYITQSILCIALLYSLNVIRTISLVQLQIVKFAYLTVMSLAFTAVFCYIIYLISQFYQQQQSIRLLSQKSFQEEEKLHLANEFRHDYRNILVSLSTYLEQDQIAEARKYVSSIVEYSNSFTESDDFSQVTAIKSPPIQGLLIKFLESCREKKIPVQLIVKQEISEFDITINLLDFIRCFSILLDNAVEASEGVERPLIEVTLDIHEQSTLIEVRNAYEGSLSISQLLKNNFTTKKGHQGKGLHIFTKLLKQYRKASYGFDLESGFFVASFSLPKSE